MRRVDGVLGIKQASSSLKIYTRKIIFRHTRTQYSNFSYNQPFRRGGKTFPLEFFFTGVFPEFSNCWIMDNLCELWTIGNQQIWLSHSDSLAFRTVLCRGGFQVQAAELFRIQCHTNDVMEEGKSDEKILQVARRNEEKKSFSRRFQQQNFHRFEFKLKSHDFHFSALAMNTKLELNC